MDAAIRSRPGWRQAEISSESQPSPQVGEIRLECGRSLFPGPREVAEERFQSLFTRSELESLLTALRKFQEMT